MGSELYLMFFAAITLLAILNPFGNLTQFLAMSDGLPLMLRKKLFRTILYTAFTIVLVFLSSGPLFMNYIFRVSLDDLRVSGGLVLIIMAIKNLLFSTKIATKDFSSYQDMDDKEILRQSLIPMAFPMLVGPGTLASVIVIAEDGGLDVALGGVMIAFIFMFILFHFAATIEKIVGKLILHVFSRIAQVFIAAMGFKMIIIGLKDIFNL
ncbi:TPA: MarC family protein [Campylobacter jejuni]|uniref:MarC family protein n=1 Tax=Campylobacter TaxID=194 RepID=UPI0009304294|nr:MULTISPECIES: MarC family protein [Campylobacter]HEE9611072.1 MarC family protein [Campylobacter jejuni subsp. jejuni]EAC1395323.1 MarC family protein [Campylobacter jejuni]EAC1919016.1 MarC family protein [Campylobacter jejuni]EAC2049209.1 MarC family protein [Campylobacter jejuni]EAH4632807.1 MarC family protein [Campylobacter jejuni]